jgi:3-oxoacyl-[acyl-carrier-protein] synthase-1
MLQVPESPVKVAGTIKEFELDSIDPEDWKFPAQYTVPRSLLRSFSPHVLYAWCALQQAIEEAHLDRADLRIQTLDYILPQEWSMRSIHKHFEKMDRRGLWYVTH